MNLKDLQDLQGINEVPNFVYEYAGYNFTFAIKGNFIEIFRIDSNNDFCTKSVASQKISDAITAVYKDMKSISRYKKDKVNHGGLYSLITILRLKGE